MVEKEITNVAETVAEFHAELIRKGMSHEDAAKLASQMASGDSCWSDGKCKQLPKI
jgi:aminoglycoside phosphotransferase family enzyme